MDQFGHLQQQLQDFTNHNMNERVTITVDRDRFIQTRNALTNAFVGLSGAIDEAVKAYVNHTNAVLDGVGGNTLDVSGLMHPFNPIGQLNHVAQIAQQAILHNGNIAPAQTQNPQLNPDGTRKKRQYKPRDPNAPKRPLTAYFRYLQEQRPVISKEIQANGPIEGGRPGDISKIATERWNSLDEQTRKPYRQAYESELGAYNEAVRQYKAATGQDVDATQFDGDDNSMLQTPAQATAAAVIDHDEDEEDDDDDDSSDEENGSESDSSSSSDEDEPTPPPKIDKKSKSPEAPKKTPKSTKKTAKAGADPVAPVQQFIPPPAPIADMPASQSKKRKGDDAEANEKKKRKSKSQSKQEEADAAAAASQLQIDPQLQQLSAGKPKKDKKKKRKSEGGTAV